MDVAGDYHPYMEQNMLKQRLSPSGKRIGRTLEEQANVFESKGLELPPDYCGSCYGSEEKEGDCCNTCDQLVAHYSLKGWATKDIRRTSEQCLRDASNPLAGISDGEGCNLSGFMLVNKVVPTRANVSFLVEAIRGATYIRPNVALTSALPNVYIGRSGGGKLSRCAWRERGAGRSLHSPVSAPGSCGATISRRMLSRGFRRVFAQWGPLFCGKVAAA